MVAKTKSPKPYSPLILHCNRLMEAFSKADDERDFYLDSIEGFMVYVDLDQDQEALASLEKELKAHAERYRLIPKLSFFETKKIMEGFVNEKVYDIDTKEKLLDIIGSKEARENFLEFIYDHHAELEKWQQFYHERSRIRIIEWLRKHQFHFVFEEDLDLTTSTIESIKTTLFQAKVSKEVASARKILEAKAKTYYSNEALNPRPKRGRPPKQAQKVEVERPLSEDIYTEAPKTIRPFLFTPDISSPSQVTFSSKFQTEEELMASLRSHSRDSLDPRLERLNQKLETLRNLSEKGVIETDLDLSMDIEPVVRAPRREVKEPAPKPAPKKVAAKKPVAKKPAAKKAAPKKKPIAKTTATKKKQPLRRIKPRKATKK